MIEFDPDKDRGNVRKHGISLARAVDFAPQTGPRWQTRIDAALKLVVKADRARATRAAKPGQAAAAAMATSAVRASATPARSAPSKGPGSTGKR
jgi:hypothetical protein